MSIAAGDLALCARYRVPAALIQAAFVVLQLLAFAHYPQTGGLVNSAQSSVCVRECRGGAERHSLGRELLRRQCSSSWLFKF
eukprot:11854-Heterococcus_DN1.PRE.2